jgi:hypothetical protein
LLRRRGPGAYQQGAIAFHASGCAALWRHCKAMQLDLLLDVHTLAAT